MIDNAKQRNPRNNIPVAGEYEREVLRISEEIWEKSCPWPRPQDKTASIWQDISLPNAFTRKFPSLEDFISTSILSATAINLDSNDVTIWFRNASKWVL